MPEGSQDVAVDTRRKENISAASLKGDATIPMRGIGLQFMTDQERLRKNAETVERLTGLEGEIEAKARAQMSLLEETARNTFRDLRAMIWVTFGFGLFLLLTSITLFIFQERTLEVLGLSGVGIADLVALLLYKPMDRLQKANADFSQQVLILKSGALSPHLELLAMNVNDPATVIAASKNIRAAAVEMARAIQEFIES